MLFLYSSKCDRSIPRQVRKSDYVHDGATKTLAETRTQAFGDYVGKDLKKAEILLTLSCLRSVDNSFFGCCFFFSHSHKSATFLTRQTPWISTEYHHQRPKGRGPGEPRVEQGKTANVSIEILLQKRGVGSRSHQFLPLLFLGCSRKLAKEKN